ncbi:alpha-ribazole kinase [Thermanaeromonas toyohensis ToBE]|uniref:Alpha-ribazole kinase n=1 Tax=Thermanaeromonas toyohensis ToBE TaxID=698762 RepID=A0A1W1VQ08_9FIRM|nr:AIR synthase related protein [Thermanaeromonas toyohensis]SMB95171.1 alpha-ribazole kinase [Thermanaeromonas toyohensis ToBE]
MRKYRDLTLIELNDGRLLVIACDSCGAIGPKEGDVVKVPGYVVGRFTSRVALMEVLAAGAWPICVVNTLCVEPFPTGADIQRGIADELRFLGVDPEALLTGSTEKNMPTSQSGVGVTVIGIASKEQLRVGRLSAGDSLGLFGLPKVGAEVSLNDPEIADLPTVMLLLSSSQVREIVPVGSRGIKAEAETLARLNDLELVWYEIPDEVDLYKSAGPATCLLVAGEEASLKLLGEKAKKPFLLLGNLIPHSKG